MCKNERQYVQNRTHWRFFCRFRMFSKKQKSRNIKRKMFFVEI